MSSASQGPPTAISLPPQRAKSVAKPRLLILSGAERGRTLELGNQPVEIGRDADCTVVLTSDGVSRKHARVQLIFGLYFVTDLESTNGTYVNQVRVTMAQLNDGDQVRVGDTVLKFVANPLEVQYAERALDLATTDGLTGAGNKRQFDENLARALHQATQQRAPLCLVLVDIDHFKRINDGLGHAAGDVALASAAQTVRGALPPGTALYRVGGEEFAVLLLGALRVQALSLAERMRAAVAAQPALHEGRSIPLTISLGVAAFEAGDDPARLYARADEKLYASKRAGRNRVS